MNDVVVAFIVIFSLLSLAAFAGYKSRRTKKEEDDGEA